MNIRLLSIAGFLLLILLGPVAIGAQTGLPDPDALAGQSLRGYTHMFLAYGIAWILVLGWIISVGRRMGRVQKNLDE